MLKSSDKDSFIQAQRLIEGIDCSDNIKIVESIQRLIKARAIVSIHYFDNILECSNHQIYFPQQINRFKRDSIMAPAYCQYNHTICLPCVSIYVKEKFLVFSIQNLYECPGCWIRNYNGSQLFANEAYRESLMAIVGAAAFQQAESLLLASVPVIIKKNYPECENCGNFHQKLISICKVDHLLCVDCLKPWAMSLANNRLKCPFNICNEPLNIQNFIKNFSKTDILYSIKSNLLEIGIVFDYCPQCKVVLNLDKSNLLTICACGAKVCSDCAVPDHFGYTCFYSISTKEYEEILLPAPKGDPVTILEKEYIKAKYAFNNFVDPKSNLEFNQAKLIVNKPLEKRYAQKKIAMAKECGGQDKINEVYFWHGSPEANYKSILKDGLKVGGVDDIAVRVGKLYGYGIYSATTPNTPIGYATGTTWLACFLGMKGVNSTVQIRDPSQLKNGKTHSYACNGDWVLFFTKEQTLPRYLIQYKVKQTK